MREIKFRAWVRWETWKNDIRHDGFMANVSDIDIEGKTVGLIDYHAQADFDEIELMQYTGLHDKNGKEIYEGDIIKWPWYKKSKQGEVAYSGAGFWVIGHLDILPLRIKECEVIGNIYENPDLLEAK